MKNQSMRIILLLLIIFVSQNLKAQQLNIEETLDYIESIENKYTNNIGYVSGDLGITVRNEFTFDKKSGILTMTAYWVNKGETIDKIESVHISDLSNEVEYSDKWMKLKCINKNCFEVTSFKYNNSTSTYTKNYHIGYSDEATLYVVQEYNAKKALTAFEYLFSLFENLKLERDKDDPFAQIAKDNEVSFKNSNSGTIQLQEQNGTFQIPVSIGGITKNFVLDSGASDTTISSKLETQLIKNGTITKENYLSNALYRIADGSIISQRRFVIKSLKVGDFTVKNIIVSVGNDDSPLLLGKNFLDRFETWVIDNSKKTIKLKA